MLDEHKKLPSKRTPGIWRKIGDENHPANYRVTSITRIHIAKICAKTRDYDEEAEANAEFICRANQAFDPLREVAQKFLDHYTGVFRYAGDENLDTEQEEIVKEMVAALKAAEEPAPPKRWNRIRDLPKEERQPFAHWLQGAACPELEWEPGEEQDGYYLHDYKDWKENFERKRK